MSYAIPAEKPKSSLSLQRSHGVSDDAGSIKKSLQKLVEDLREPVTTGKLWNETVDALVKAREEASVEDWDGYGAKPISEFSYVYALELLEAMPTSLPIPEVVVDPDGDITFEWFGGTRRVFSLSVGGRGRLSWAYLYGSTSSYGDEYFVDEVPDSFLDKIRRVVS